MILGLTAPAAIGVTRQIGRVQERDMASRKPRLGLVKRSVIFTGTFIFAWGFVGVIPVKLPFDLPAIALPRLDWLQPASASLSGGSVSAMPEPMAWALMMAGMLMIGATLRLSPRERVSVRY
jgi:hypothetical protein